MIEARGSRVEGGALVLVMPLLDALPPKRGQIDLSDEPLRGRQVTDTDSYALLLVARYTAKLCYYPSVDSRSELSMFDARS